VRNILRIGKSLQAACKCPFFAFQAACKSIFFVKRECKKLQLQRKFRIFWKVLFAGPDLAMNALQSSDGPCANVKLKTISVRVAELYNCDGISD